MKTIILIAVLLFIFNGYTNSQDIFFPLKETDISYTLQEKVKIYNSKEIKFEQKSADFNSVKQLTFMNNDEVKLFNDENEEITLNIKDIAEVSMKTGSFSPIHGGVLGGLCGLLTGALIGYAVVDSKSPEYFLDFGGFYKTVGSTIAGGLIGLAIGTIGGVIISNTINTDNFELWKIPINKKRDRLIRFLNKI